MAGVTLKILYESCPAHSKHGKAPRSGFSTLSPTQAFSEISAFEAQYQREDDAFDVIGGGGGTGARRHVTAQMRKKAFANYDLEPDGQNYELDHLIPLALAGDNDVQNLWPQHYAGAQNAHVKDRLEVTLLGLLCDDKVELEAAQRDIAANWVIAYKKYITNGDSLYAEYFRRLADR